MGEILGRERRNLVGKIRNEREREKERRRKKLDVKTGNRMYKERKKLGA